MQLGMIGLGRMGGNMADRLRRGGHDVVGYDPVSPLATVHSLEELVAALKPPRVAWVMVPAGKITADTIASLGDLLSPATSYRRRQLQYTDDKVHAALAKKGIGFCDCGVSGGVGTAGRLRAHGRRLPDDIARVQPVFDTLKPEGEAGFVHAGPVGAGHFAKMVHNGIEYGMMQAYGEGYEVLKACELIEDLPGVIKSWTSGTVIRSWLLELLVRALDQDPGLDRIHGWAQDSGEGRWTVEAAIEYAVPMPAISAALFARFASRQEDSPTMKVVAALRNQFGGHAVESAGGTLGATSMAPPGS